MRSNALKITENRNRRKKWPGNHSLQLHIMAGSFVWDTLLNRYTRHSLTKQVHLTWIVQRMSSDMLNQTWSDSHYRDGWICSWVIGLRCCKSRVLTVGPWQPVHSPLRVCTWLTCHLHWIPLTHLLLLDCSLQRDRQGEWEEAKKERKIKKRQDDILAQRTTDITPYNELYLSASSLHEKQA